ncbi:hypothetical protein E1301_Tti023590 [Triplophysa tibetana]|uniref:Reverse transcriptase zinc-binding domain-containing protein n=1 Tax=Triplophysa tibetana TaxID=1572043 RepID=A0A5A9NGZ7_9TELE|nr:hypothetical protein E1301_Tti023590 [Triplophysa tibetana]
MDKSKIIIFQKKSRFTEKKYIFTLGGSILSHVTNYNYLGLTISASGQFNMAIKELAEKARRVYYGLRKTLFQFNLPIRLWLKIFDGVIKPILLYGSEIWGPKFQLNYESWDKCPVEIFQLEFCKNILGTHRNTSNLGCRAELGKFPLLSEIQKRASKFWFHLSESSPDNYHHSAFRHNTSHPESDPFLHLLNKHQLNSSDQFRQSKLRHILNTTQEEYLLYWQNKINEVNKLTCFRKIRTDYNLAPYLLKLKDYRQRKLVSKYRLSDHSLCIETGRHRQNWTSRDHRLCSNCTDGVVEDELHFLTQCSKYQSIRQKYFTLIGNVYPEFHRENDIEKLSYLLGEMVECIDLSAQYLFCCHNMRDKN